MSGTWLHTARTGPWWGVALTLALHALVAVPLGSLGLPPLRTRAEPAPLQLSLLALPAPAPAALQDLPLPPPERPAPPPPLPVPAWPDATPTRAPASREAPPPPTAEDWALAARYTLKNSKAYRHSWGQQVRSLMGTAVEGPDQGLVRLRVEIAPDGTLARVETLWTTSPVAERLAHAAIARMPAGPPTPTGQPLVFERTIAFTPHATDDPPSYRGDCRPDPPAFANPFAWNGRAPPPIGPTAAEPVPPDPQALEDCLRQLPPESIDAEQARDRRLMERWGWRSSAPPGR